MIRIVVASLNPVKVGVARRGVERMFPAETIEHRAVSVPSGVRAQPFSHLETLTGARNRADAAAAIYPDADFWFGIEGGVEEQDGELAAFAWVVARSGSRYGKACSGTFYLPHEVAQLVRGGMELGEADDRVFGRINSKQANGAVGLLTDDAIDRAAFYEQAVMLALIPFKNPLLYS
jgi:inosine/xanthosine triphosphatase